MTLFQKPNRNVTEYESGSHRTCANPGWHDKPIRNKCRDAAMSAQRWSGLVISYT
jgi:hypothetical protein